MGNSVAEVDAVLKQIDGVLPVITGGVSIFMPSAAGALTVLQPVFETAVKAVDVVAQDTGKPLSTVIQDVINHLTPGKPDAPSLS
jgi:hypothetical protein